MANDSQATRGGSVHLETYANQASHLRSALKTIAGDVRAFERRLLEQCGELTGDTELDGEAAANALMAFRHLEDASMRLGKVMQALNGGLSVYDQGEKEVVSQKREF